MNFVGVVRASKSVTPWEMHFPDGRSFPLFAWRSSKIALARGVQGTSTPSAAISTSHLPLLVCQMPERSGWRPSGVLGAGALRFGLPSAVRGMFGVGNPIHCAAAVADRSAQAAATSVVRIFGLMARKDTPRRQSQLIYKQHRSAVRSPSFLTSKF